MGNSPKRMLKPDTAEARLGAAELDRLEETFTRFSHRGTKGYIDKGTFIAQVRRSPRGSARRRPVCLVPWRQGR